jgi:hypothetical protein
MRGAAPRDVTPYHVTTYNYFLFFFRITNDWA